MDAFFRLDLISSFRLSLTKRDIASRRSTSCPYFEDTGTERLLEYRRGHALLPGHPELGMTPGVEFDSGRLGHMWPYVNERSARREGQIVFCLGSNGSQM